MKKATKITVGYLAVTTAWYALEFLRMRGTRCNDKHCIDELYDALYTGNIHPDYQVEVGNVELNVQLNVQYNPYVFLIMNKPGEMCFVAGKNVYVNGIFTNLSRDTQKAVLSHEAGHVLCSHKGSMFESFKRVWYILKGDVMEKELEADTYAAAVVGRTTMIKALKEIKKQVPGLLSKIEIQRRINAL